MPVKLMMRPENEPFRINEATLQKARAIGERAGTLIGHAIQTRSMPALREEAEYVARSIEEPQVDDVRNSLVSAAQSFLVYSQVGGAPVLTTPEIPVTVSLRSVFSDFKAKGIDDNEVAQTAERMGAALSDWASFNDGRSIALVEQAQIGFIRHFTDFIGNRIAGLKHWVGNGIDQEKGLFDVEVKCRTAGYRILVTPAYLVDWVFFGSPSSPVTKKLQPGRYIFGTDSIDGTITDDGVIFQIPDDYKPQLRRF